MLGPGNGKQVWMNAWMDKCTHVALVAYWSYMLMFCQGQYSKYTGAEVSAVLGN